MAASRSNNYFVLNPRFICALQLGNPCFGPGDAVISLTLGLGTWETSIAGEVVTSRSQKCHAILLMKSLSHARWYMVCTWYVHGIDD